MGNFNRNSFTFRLMTAFLLVAIVPVVMISLLSYSKTISIYEKNMDELTQVYLSQTVQSVKTILSSYEDLAYQIYTNESAAELAVKIDAGEDTSVSKSQLKRLLRGYAYAKSYVESIMVITKDGHIMYYDMLTAASTRSSWLDSFGATKEELYKSISDINNTRILSTQYAMKLGEKSYYLFHITHRIINYRYINQKEAVLILSIDQQLLNETCNRDLSKDKKPNSVNFIVDAKGNLISFPNNTFLGTKIVDMDQTEEEQRNSYEKLVKTTRVLTGKYVTTHTLYDKDLGWTFITVSDKSGVISSIENQQKVAVLIIFLSSITLIALIVMITSYLTKSIGKVVKAMKSVEQGKLSIRVITDKNMPTEIAIIADQFNHMVEWLKESMEKEKQANIKQKNAEIAALEAQINPHFLYNTLDTINWMAIDNGQFDISNTINSLAHILRYSIDRSNTSVEIAKEVEWLKKYIFLQQTRLKNTFECNIHIDPQALHYHIHKLLLQPFIENAILHGFEGSNRKHILDISINLEDDSIRIIIQDNGKGIPASLLENLNQGIPLVEAEKSHIGMKNAVERLTMYYGELCDFYIDSELEVGTRIIIHIPKIT